MPLSPRNPPRVRNLTSLQSNMENGSLRLRRDNFSALSLRALRRMFWASASPPLPPTNEEDSVLSTESAGDFDLMDLQEQMEQERLGVSGPKTGRFCSLWAIHELEAAMKQMLRIAGCKLKILELIKDKNSEEMTEFPDDAEHEYSLVEQEVALLAGCLFGRHKLAKSLLKRGVSAHATDPEGRSALHLASFSGSMKTVKCLVKHGAKVEQRDARHSITPLACAAAANANDVVEFLISQGADVNYGLEDTEQTALHYAVRANATACVALLLKAGAKIIPPSADLETPPHIAADCGFDECLALMLSEKPDVNVALNPGKKTPLHLAADTGSLKCAQLLLDAGATVDLRNSRGQTALHLAAGAQSAEIIELLLDRGADINARDNERRTPLHSCIGRQCRSLECVKLLLNGGAVVNARDSAGFTALHLASINEYDSCVELLMDHGGDVTIKNRAGISCLHLIKHRTPSVLSNLPQRFSRAIHFSQKEGMPHDKFSELTINFKPLISRTKGECNVLKALIDIDQHRILKHPLCESFLHMKWVKVRRFLFLNLFYYLIFCILVTCYVVGTASGDCYNVGKALHDNDCQSNYSGGELSVLLLHQLCSESGNSEKVQCSTVNTGLPASVDLCQCTYSFLKLQAVTNPWLFYRLWFVLVIFDIILIIKELFQLVQDPFRYFRNPENLAEWGLMFSIVLIGSPLTGHIDTWQKHLCAVSGLICWFELMMLVGRVPRLGLYIHMFSRVLEDFFQFLIAYASIAVGCSIAFMILLPGFNPMSDIWRSLLRVLVMMTGEFEFDSMFYEDDHDVLNPTAMIVLASFLFLITIILMNLLVGLAVSDIQGLRRTAKLYRLVRLTDQIFHIEGTLFSKKLTAVLPQRVCAWIAEHALLSPSGYRYTFVLRPNDPNDRRLTKEIMEAACRLAKGDKKASGDLMRESRLSRQISVMSTQYDVTGSDVISDEEDLDRLTACDMIREARVGELEAKMDLAEKTLSALLNEVKNVSLAVTKIADFHGLPHRPQPRELTRVRRELSGVQGGRDSARSAGASSVNFNFRPDTNGDVRHCS